MGEDSFYDSKWWEEEREAVLDTWNGLCEWCGCEVDSPHVHHRYGLRSRRYAVLCPDCHADHHGNETIRNFRREKSEGSRCKCKFCGAFIQWGQINGRWRPFNERMTAFHVCIPTAREEGKE